jgi:DNA-binding transcriptional LysR family regulator
MASVHEAFAALEELRDEPAGLLRLAASRLSYELVLAARMPEFLALYPDIELDVSLDDAFVDIVEQGFDAGLRIGEMLDREMVGVRVSEDLRMAVVGSAAYFERHGKPRHPRELHRHDCITYRQKTSNVVYRWEFTESGEDFSVAVTGRVQINDAYLMVRSALDGLGLAYTLESQVREELASKRLLRVLADFCPPFPGFFLYYPSRQQLSPKLKALVEFFKLPPSKKAGRH